MCSGATCSGATGANIRRGQRHVSLVLLCGRRRGRTARRRSRCGRETLIGAVDIGGTKIAVGLIDDCGRVICRLEAPTEAERGYAVGVQKISEMLHEVLGKTSATIRGIGIGSTG